MSKEISERGEKRLIRHIAMFKMIVRGAKYIDVALEYSALFKMIVRGAKYIDVALEYSALMEEVGNVLNTIPDAIIREHRRDSIAPLNVIAVTPIMDTNDLLTYLQNTPDNWCQAADLYLERMRVRIIPTTLSEPIGAVKVHNNLILSPDRVINALQAGFCQSHGIVGGDQLKIAFIVNGVEVDPKTVEVRTTLN